MGRGGNARARGEIPISCFKNRSRLYRDYYNSKTRITAQRRMNDEPTTERPKSPLTIMQQQRQQQRKRKSLTETNNTSLEKQRETGTEQRGNFGSLLMGGWSDDLEEKTKEAFFVHPATADFPFNHSFASLLFGNAGNYFHRVMQERPPRHRSVDTRSSIQNSARLLRNKASGIKRGGNT